VTRVDLSAERVVCFALQPGTPARLANRFCCSLTPIGHRDGLDFRIRQRVAQPFCNVFGNFPRVERSFEFVWGNQDFHHHNCREAMSAAEQQMRFTEMPTSRTRQRYVATLSTSFLKILRRAADSPFPWTLS